MVHRFIVCGFALLLAAAGCGTISYREGPDATVEDMAPSGALATIEASDELRPNARLDAAPAAVSDAADEDARGEGLEGEASAEVDAEAESDAEAPAADASGEPCPPGMVYVKTRFCPDVERRCLDVEYDKINHLEICHEFAHETFCRTHPRKIAFCIDRYEYPNIKGAHPAWMVDWYQAQATCESKGKRLCWASEWTAACEGPAQTPFPYGWERDHDKCNMDSFYIDPIKPGPRAQFLFYSKDQDIALRELSRLDQSVPSGSLPTCVSGFGVYDMPGNIDEWVVSDQAPQEKSKWAGLKGGAWGHVRSQCRPMTFSHDPDFAYYFVGFRCCADAPGAPRWVPSSHAVPAPPVAAHDFVPDPVIPMDPPGPTKTRFTRMGHRQ